MSDHIQEVNKALDSVERCLRKVKAFHVNSAETKNSIRDFVRGYFERSRPGLLSSVSAEQELAQLDGLMQDLLRYSQRRTSIDDYRRCLSASKRALSEIELRSLNSLSRNNSVAKAATVREPLMGNDKLIDSHTGSGSPNSDRLH